MPFNISSICDGKIFTPFTLTISSVLPKITSILGYLEPHGHSPGIILERSCVRYLISGAPSLCNVVITISPISPSGRFFPVLGSTISI